MRRRFASLLLSTASLLMAQDFSKLPDWAALPAREAASEPAPLDEDAWILLDRTEIAYAGGGEIRQRRYRVIKVLGERGTGYGTFTIHGLGGKASKVKKLKGWNLRLDGDLEKLDSDQVVTINDASNAEFSTDTLTGATLARVAKGSVVAFESHEVIQSPLGPVAAAWILESAPVRKWELDVAKAGGWFTNLKSVEVKIDRRHFEGWIGSVEALGSHGIRVVNLAALPKHEDGHPHLFNVLPSVQVRFLDPDLPLARMWTSWDGVAKWTEGLYASATLPASLADLHGQKGLDGVRAVWDWMGKTLAYKQVYMTPERGWVPEVVTETRRKLYGDCKDLSAFFLAEAKALGFSAAPVLARIVNGEIEPGLEPFPVFNHVISAIRLDGSAGYPGEIETPKGRYLLLDPTDPFTPFGLLSSAHRGRRVMICSPDGALWVDIPDRAIQKDRLDVTLTGELRGSELQAVLKLRESGGFWGLRGAAHRGGVKAVRESLMVRWLDLPPSAHIEVVRVGNPLDRDSAFDVEVKILHPDGFHRNGQEWSLVGWGIPFPPSLIQKLGSSRRYPVSASFAGELVYHATLTAPPGLVPVLPERTVENSFRAFVWKAEAKAEGGMTRLELDLRHRNKPAHFGLDQRDQGLQAWKQDRSLVRSLREDGLAFKASPH